jgi:hypothetical protein
MTARTERPDPLPMDPFRTENSTTDIQYCKDHPEHFANFPDLMTALRDMEAGGELMFDRHQIARHAHIPDSFLYYAWKHTKKGQHFEVIRHSPCLSVQENKQAIEDKRQEIAATLGTSELPKVLKTVTLALPYKYKMPEGYPERFDAGTAYVLLSGIGDFLVKEDLKKAIAAAVRVNSEARHNAIVNPSSERFDTEALLRVVPGLVKPILWPDSVGNLLAICYQHPQEADENPYVAVTVSPVDSILLPVGVFEASLTWYVNKFYPDVHKFTDGPSNLDVYLLNQHLSRQYVVES